MSVPMKDSGVEWLGKVPAHWGVFRFKQSTTLCQNGLWGGEPNGVDDIECVRVADFDRPTLRVNAEIPTLRAVSQKERVGRLLERGNLLLEKSGGGENQPVGQVVLYDRIQQAICSNFVAKVELAPGMEPRFWNYQHHAAYAARINVQSIKQTSGIQNLDQHQYLNEMAAFPPLEEQSAIADHLDSATARIDALVIRKTRFIDLLREKRQALITNAVTKGLGANVPMKDSGVEWLGHVPEHWTVARLATAFREVARAGSPELPVLSISIHDGISDDELDETERNRKVTHIEDRSKYKRVSPGNLAYNMMRAWQGAFGAVSVIGQVSPAYVVAEPKVPINTNYVELLLRTPMAIEEMRRFSRGIADFRSRLYWEHFRDVRVCLPPLEEQGRIVSKLAAVTSRIDILIAKTERSIELLREHRTALITAAVTGKIDLRNDLRNAA